MQRNRVGVSLPHGQESSWPILVCLLGEFRLLKTGQRVPVRPGGKTQKLLRALALRYEDSIARDALLDRLWPGTPRLLAGQALNSVVYSLHKSLGTSIGGAAPVVHRNDVYRLNVEAGVGVDVACFDMEAEVGDREARAGNGDAAAAAFRSAILWYKGDLCDIEDVQSVTERERLRARFLNLLARLADHHFGKRDYATCQDHALLLLSYDPCREDAHRLVMRCYVRRGERAQAMRQYRLCERILRAEFDASPEPSTRALFDRIRLDPDSV